MLIAVKPAGTKCSCRGCCGRAARVLAANLRLSQSPRRLHSSCLWQSLQFADCNLTSWLNYAFKRFSRWLGGESYETDEAALAAGDSTTLDGWYRDKRDRGFFDRYGQDIVGGWDGAPCQ